jgi:hypothetical protein
MIRKFYILCVVFLFFFSFAVAEEPSVKGMLADNNNIFDNDAAIQAYLNKITEETGALVVIFTEATFSSDLKTWGNSVAKKLKLTEIGKPKKNVLIGHFKDKNVLYLAVNVRNSVKEKLKDDFISAAIVAINANNSDGFLAALKILGEGLGVEKESRLEGAFDFKKLSLKECEEGLETRRVEYEIPDKICYWDIMLKIYDEKCDNLNEAKIKKIFKEKESYRKKTEGKYWLKLEADFENCINVEYDCENWIKRGFGNAYATHLSPNMIDSAFHGAKPLISVNPFFIFNKNIVQNTFLIHEGLHSIQERTGAENFALPYIDLRKRNYLSLYSSSGLGTTSFSLFAMENSSYKQYKKQYDLMVSIVGDHSKIMKFINDEKEAYENATGITEKWDTWAGLWKVEREKDDPDHSKMDPILKEHKLLEKKLKKDLSELETKMHYNFLFSEFGGDGDISIGEENLYYKYLMKNSKFKSDLESYLALINEFNALETTGYFEVMSAYSYVNQVSEIDPRLSEVHRWWLDKTASECEIIDTPKKAESVLKAFIAEKDIAEEYLLTQIQLEKLLEIAEKTDRGDILYKRLASRLPGLAMDDDSSDDTTTALA